MGCATRTVRVALVLAVWAALGACRDEARLVGAPGRLRLSREAVDFGVTWLGQGPEARVRVHNGGRAPLRVEWTAVGPPFAVEGLPSRVEGAQVEVVLRYRPEAPGRHQAVLEGLEEGGGRVRLRLEGRALEVPACPAPRGCVGWRFEASEGRCVEVPLAEGARCEEANACLEEAVCRAGRCVGRPRVCDDGDACTTDVCDALRGCQAVPGPACPGDGACRVGVCVPEVGCTLAPAPDGRLCGEGVRRGCDDAEVCMAGQCVARDLPDGFVCAPASPCQGEGRCRGPVCVRPGASVLAPDWEYDGQARGEGLHDVVVGPQGDVTLSGFFERVVLDAAGAAPVRSGLAPRRCMLWNERLVCMDTPTSGQVSLVERASGAARWSFNLARERPELTRHTRELFMARLAVMAPDRLAALFEAYPVDAAPDTLCRVYFLVVLDAGGRLVSARALEDALLSRCDHPHPFGLASDARGDLYVTFSPTANTGAPLRPGAPTLLLAYSADGVERWRRTEAFGGGELAVVGGLLVPERAPYALRTEDGAPVGSLPPAGRAVATHEVLVTSPEGATVDAEAQPMPLSTRLRAYGLPGLGQAWDYRLPQGWSFTSKEVRLGEWGTGRGRRTLVLGMATDGKVPALVGLEARGGAEAFRCELGYTPRGVVQLVELGPGSLVLMDGAMTCGECDPPFAYSRARFLRFSVPGLEPARAPWPGTFGGPGHDHHEDP